MIESYYPLGSVLLSPAAQRLDPASLGEQAELAIDLLGLRYVEVITDPTDLEVVQRAIALQINYMLAHDPTILSEGRGRRSVTYREDLIDPRALSLITGIIPISESQGWEDSATSLRTQN